MVYVTALKKLRTVCVALFMSRELVFVVHTSTLESSISVKPVALKCHAVKEH